MYQSRSDRTTKQVGEVQLLQIAKRLSKRKNPNIIAKKEKDRVCYCFEEVHRKSVGVMFAYMSKYEKIAQINIKEGIRRHGQKAVEVLLKDVS